MATDIQAALLGEDIARPHADCLEAASMTIHTVIRSSKRARSVTLRVLPYPLQAELVIPQGYSRKLALSFLESKQEWIAIQAAQYPPMIPLMPGSVIPVLGKKTTIRHVGVRGTTRLEGDDLWISGLEEQCEARVKRLLKKILTAAIKEQAAHYAGLLGVNYQKITLKDTTSRWGSCSSQGNLAFCWKLVFAPLPVLSYVVAHEVAHLKEMNHSTDFWQLVAKICPGFVEQRQWLKRHGIELHRYGGNCPLLQQR